MSELELLDKPASFRITKIAVPLLMAVLSVTLFSVSWSRWLASFQYLPVEIAIDSYYTSGKLPTERLPVLISYANEAIERSDHHRYRSGLSNLQLLRAIDRSTPAAERRGTYELSLKEMIRSAQAAPAQSSAWLRVAYLGWLLHAEPEDVLSAWKMSVFTGRIDYSQFRQRLEIGVAFHSFMDQEALAMLRDQLLLAWRTQPGSVVAVLKAYDKELEVTRALIENTDPKALQEMELWLEKIH